MARIIRRLQPVIAVGELTKPAPGELRELSANPRGDVDTPRINVPSGFQADTSCRLAEFDFAGIEAIITGYQQRWINPQHARDYIRLSRLGVHAALTARVVGRPADLAWPDDRLGEYLRAIKEEYSDSPGKEYDTAKRTIHGCVPGDHQVLTPIGWLPIDQLVEGIAVAQWENGKISFVVPSQITRSTVDDPRPLVQLCGRSLKIQMTCDHRVPLRIGDSDRVKAVPAIALEDRYGGRIPIAGAYTDGTIAWSPQLALLVAGQADGNLVKDRWVFHLVKDRKIRRLISLLKQAGIEYDDQPCDCHPTGRRIRFKLWPDVWFESYKVFRLSAWMQLTAAARQSFLDEVLLWDGTTVTSQQDGRPHRRYEYLTTIKANAVVVQTIAHLSNRQGWLRDTKRCGFSGNVLYCVSLNQRQWARLECQVVSYDVPTPETVYCVTVPSSYFLVRWQDTISVTGNSNFGLTPFGAAEQFPKFFPTLAHAQKFFKYYYELCPSLTQYHFDVRKQAKDLGYLGGPTMPGQPVSRWDHPYGYKHWFWDVLGYQPTDEVTAQRWLRHPERKHRIVRLHGRWFKVILGGDSKRVIAFYPQSIAAGVLKRAELRLFHPESPDYIGDAYFGRTPLLHPIHDSLFLHVPNAVFDRVVRIVVRVMQDAIPELPIPREWGWGNYLRIGVDAKAGRSWDKKSMSKVKIDPLLLGIDNPEDDPVLPREDSDGEDWSSLERQVA